MNWFAALLLGILIGIHWPMFITRVHRFLEWAVKPRRWRLPRRRGKLREYTIGGRTYAAAPLNKAVMRAAIDAQADVHTGPSVEHLGPFAMFMGIAPPDPAATKMETLACIDALYDQLAVLLVDKETGQAAESDHLGAYLTIDEARDMLNELLRPLQDGVGVG